MEANIHIGEVIPNASVDNSIPGIDATLDNGWWMTIGAGVAIAMSFTPLAPLGLGIVVVATLFQLEKMFQGTNPTQPKEAIV
jgi:hypothetical protein